MTGARRRLPAHVARRAAIRARGLTKRYGSVLAARRARPRRPRRLDLRPARAQRRRQDDDDPDPDRPGPGRPAGRATVAGVDVGLDRPELHRRLGYLDQDPRFYALDAGRELLELTGRLSGLRRRRAPRRASRRCSTGSACAAPRERRIGGCVRRDAPAARDRPGRCIHRPAVVFLDEPVSSLDPEGRRDLLELIGGLRGDDDGDPLDPRPRRRRAGLRPGRDPRSRPARDRGSAGATSSRSTPGRSSSSTPSRARTPPSRRCAAGLAGGAVGDRRDGRAGGRDPRSPSRTPARPRRGDPAARRRRGRPPGLVRARPADPRGRLPRARRAAERRTTSTGAASSGRARSEP